MNLKKLDEEFKSIWTQAKDIPSSLDAWQHNLNEFLQTTNTKNADRISLGEYLNSWEETLKNNRLLIEDHQKKLILDLAKGDESYIKQAQTNKFK